MKESFIVLSYIVVIVTLVAILIWYMWLAFTTIQEVCKSLKVKLVKGLSRLKNK